jgi:curved DNA-binding protein CbpA
MNCAHNVRPRVSRLSADAAWAGAMNYYLILGVPRTASVAAIRTAFRGLVRQYHPDAGAGSSEQRFREIVEAYETLSDPNRRREYDASLRVAINPSWIEPLTSRRPEPLFSPRVTRSSLAVDVWTYHEDAVDELFRSLERLFWDF